MEEKSSPERIRRVSGDNLSSPPVLSEDGVSPLGKMRERKDPEESQDTGMSWLSCGMTVPDGFG